MTFWSAAHMLSAGAALPFLVEGWVDSVQQPPGYEDFMTPRWVPVVSRIAIAVGTATAAWEIWKIAQRGE